MKIAIRENEIFKESNWQEHFKQDYVSGIDKDGNNVYSTKIDLTLPPYNYQIIEVLDVYCADLRYSDFELVGGRYAFDNTKQLSRQELSVLEREIPSLTGWFDEYDRKISEHLRCERLGAVCHHNIVELDIEARQKQERLAMIKSRLDGSNGNQ